MIWMLPSHHWISCIFERHSFTYSLLWRVTSNPDSTITVFTMSLLSLSLSDLSNQGRVDNGILISKQPSLIPVPTCEAGLAHGWRVAAWWPCPVDRDHPESATKVILWFCVSGVMVKLLKFLKTYLLAVRSCWFVMTAKLFRTVLRLARTYEIETRDWM